MISWSSFAGGERRRAARVASCASGVPARPGQLLSQQRGVGEGGEAFRKVSVVDKVGRVSGAFEVPPNLFTSRKKLG